MKDENKTKAQLIVEIEEMRQRIAAIEGSETEWKQTEQALRETKEWFEKAIMGAPIPMIVSNSDLGTVFYNDKVTEEFGYTIEDLPTPEEWWPAVYPDADYRQKVHHSWKEAIEQAAKTGSEIEMQEYEIVIKNGSVRHVEFKMTVLGEMSLISMNDITERKQAEETLKESAILFNRVPVTLYRASPEGKFLDFNPALLDLLGFPDRETAFAINIVKQLYLKPGDRTPWKAILDRDGVLRNAEFQLRRHDGTIIWVKDTVRVIRDADGETLYYEGSLEDISEWKQTEQALAEANVIINRSPAVAFLWRNEEGWPVEFVSENVENLFGYSQEDFVERKMSYFDIIHSEDKDWVLEQVARDSRKTGLKKFAHDPYRIIAKSGEIKWITDRSYVRRDLQGIITHFEGIVYDTTERKQVEKRLEIQRQRLENILQGTNAGTWDWNIGTGEVILNERWAEIIGRTLEELTPTTIQIWNDNVHPEDLSDANVLLEKHFNGELDYYDVIFRQLHKNGSWVWVHARGKVVEWDDDGMPLRMSGTHLDITERKLAEEERENLFVSEQQQRVLAETLSEGTLAITSKGDTESILEEILAQSQRLVPFKSGNIMYLEEGEMHLGAWRGYAFEKLEDFFFNSGQNFFPVELESIRTGIPAIIPDVSLAPDWVIVEETAWIKSWMGVPIYLQDEVLGILRLDSDEIDKFSAEDAKRLQPLLNAAAVAIDKARLVRRVTEENAERKLAEEKVSLLNQELEQRVLERTAELSATINEIESFSYSVSHDLRAPLRAISGYSEILMDEYTEVLDHEAREYLTNIDQASRKMDDLISGMLALTRLSRKNLSLSSFPPGELAIQVYETFKAAENDRVIEFQAETECRINADQSLIKILLTNLISNAVKFTREEKSPKIEFGCAQEESRMIFYLRDNGVGFDMTYVDKIFSPFHRLHGEDQFEGTGIGLAIAYRVVQRHKGEIWVESEEGEGTTVYFTIENLTI